MTISDTKRVEFTRVVCFCAFSSSSVSDYLNSRERYLLKVCRDASSFEHSLDSIHPDIIIIDCTGKVDDAGFSGEGEDDGRDEKIIDLRDKITEESREIDESEDASDESQDDNGIPASDTDTASFLMSNHLDSPGNLPEIDPQWSLSVQGYISDRIPLKSIVNRGKVLFIFDSDPGSEVRIGCFNNGCDVLVSPFSSEELDFRIKVHAERSELGVKVAWQRANLDKAVEHIDRLRHIIFATREEFKREKDLLHNSLKQINMMSNEREELKKELHLYRSKLKENVAGINEFLCRMVESRNEYRKGHSKRVSEIAEFVAEKMGLKSPAIRRLKNAAMLHEVGMLLIPSSILDKEHSMLSDYEKIMITRHPVNGAKYLKECPGFERVADIIHHLHENSDGTGFPDGLKKRYIPLPSKILAGADLLDQLWIDNPGISVEKMLEILEGFAGSRLDPAVVNRLEMYVVTILSHKTVHYGTGMREIAVHLLKPGMVIGMGLFTRTGTKLFSPGTVMTESLIAMLERYTKEYPVDETVFIKLDL